MNIKTLLSTLGHVSVATSLDIYTHSTDKMKKDAAVKIDKHIAKSGTVSQALERSKVIHPK